MLQLKPNMRWRAPRHIRVCGPNTLSCHGLSHVTVSFAEHLGNIPSKEDMDHTTTFPMSLVPMCIMTADFSPAVMPTPTDPAPGGALEAAVLPQPPGDLSVIKLDLPVSPEDKQLGPSQAETQTYYVKPLDKAATSPEDSLEEQLQRPLVKVPASPERQCRMR
ncbi:uncharacterized protein LOC143830453 isoform X2 [Paroedura picta]|uniref:uncharacterized protein LOC143830453 isoform X2 n=1 Tax=Paroedura picta TaxID=143630 RepID=UPI0040575B07